MGNAQVCSQTAATQSGHTHLQSSSVPPQGMLGGVAHVGPSPPTALISNYQSLMGQVPQQSNYPPSVGGVAHYHQTPPIQLPGGTNMSGHMSQVGVATGSRYTAGLNPSAAAFTTIPTGSSLYPPTGILPGRGAIPPAVTLPQSHHLPPPPPNYAGNWKK